MGLAQFSITDRNPNDFNGGHGGCLCSPVKTHQCTPPYCTFQAVDMENPRSPIPVLSLSCAMRFASAPQAPAEAAPVHDRRASASSQAEPRVVAARKRAQRTAL